MVSVTIGGFTPEALFTVQDGQTDGGKLAKAIIEVGATPNNRNNINDGDEVVITRGGSTTYTGYVMGRPSRSRDGVLEVEAMDKRLELKHVQVNRTFHNMDTGEIVRHAVDYEAVPLDRRAAFTADTPGDWDSDAPVFETYTSAPSGSTETDTTPLWNYGSDLMFVGFRDGASGTYYARMTDVDSAITAGDPNGGIQRVFTRVLVNNTGQQMSLEFELRDAFGRNYVWEIDARGSGFTEHQLDAADADPSGQLTTDLTAEYRFTIEGRLNENRGVFIDAAHTIPYVTDPSGTSISTSGVKNTGRKITRGVDLSAMELIQDLAQEDRHDFWIDTSDTLHYKPSGGQPQPSLDIVEGTTAVTSADFDRNAESVDNKVVVQGDSDIQVVARDPASIQFYGVAPRSEPIVDSTIQTRGEAEARARGYLAENAWSGSIATFEIADTDYQDARVGDRLYVDWPTQDVDGEFVVDKTDTAESGVVTLELSVGVQTGVA